MVKRREPLASVPKPRRTPTNDEVEAFASGADRVPAKVEMVKSSPDPKAKRNFKSINLPLNEHEYLQLDKLSNDLSRSKLNIIRHALNTLAASIEHT